MNLDLGIELREARAISLQKSSEMLASRAQNDGSRDGSFATASLVLAGEQTATFAEIEVLRAAKGDRDE